MATDHNVIRKWWAEVGPILGQDERILKPHPKGWGRMFFAVKIAFFLSQGLEPPETIIRTTYKKPGDLLPGDTIFGYEKGQVWEVTEDPYRDDKEASAWWVHAERVYYATSHPPDDHTGKALFIEDENNLIRCMYPAWNRIQVKSALGSAASTIENVIHSQEPHRWSGRIITPDWVDRNASGNRASRITGAIIHDLSVLIVNGR